MCTKFDYEQKRSVAALPTRRLVRVPRTVRIAAGVVAVCAALTVSTSTTLSNQELNQCINILEEQVYELNERNIYLASVNSELNQYVAELTEQNKALARYNRALTEALKEREAKTEATHLAESTDVSETSFAIYNIPLSTELQEYTYNLCVDYGIADYYELVLAMMWQESNFVPDVISATDDYGLMQINWTNHGWLSDQLNIDNFLDPKQNIHAGIYIISSTLLKYNNMHMALMAYNMGEGGASTYWNSGVYSNAYSNSVMSKYDAIKANSYK